MRKLLGLLLCCGICMMLGLGSVGCTKKAADKKTPAVGKAPAPPMPKKESGTKKEAEPVTKKEAEPTKKEPEPTKKEPEPTKKEPEPTKKEPEPTKKSDTKKDTTDKKASLDRDIDSRLAFVSPQTSLSETRGLLVPAWAVRGSRFSG